MSIPSDSHDEESYKALTLQKISKTQFFRREIWGL